MVVLDNLVVNVALPSIHRDLGASIQALEWTVNAYVLAYAVLLLPAPRSGTALGASACSWPGSRCSRSPPPPLRSRPITDLLMPPAPCRERGRDRHPADPDAAGGRLPAHPAGDRHRRLVGYRGIAVALGPLVGGAVVQGASWHWIFWINVPSGPPRAARRVAAHREPWAERQPRPGGLALASTGLFGIVFGLVRSQSLGWTSTEVLGR